jgi:hygromycin-B 7''-O-kinase
MRDGSAIVYAAGDHVVKLLPPMWIAEILPERLGLGAACGVDPAVPRLVAEGELDGWPYLVQTRCPGVPARDVWRTLEPAERLALATRIGELMARLHALAPAGLGEITPDWDAFMRARRDGLEAHHRKGGASEAWVMQVRTFADALPPLFEPGFRPVFLHADMTYDNLHLARRGGAWAVSGLLDFGDAMVGHALYEFAAPGVFLTSGDPALQRALLRGYGFAAADVTPELLLRLTGYALLHRFGQLAEILRVAPGTPPRDVDELHARLWGDAFGSTAS